MIERGRVGRARLCAAFSINILWDATTAQTIVAMEEFIMIFVFKETRQDYMAGNFDRSICHAIVANLKKYVELYPEQEITSSDEKYKKSLESENELTVKAQMILEALQAYLDADPYDDDSDAINKNASEAFKMLGEIFPALWF